MAKINAGSLQASCTIISNTLLKVSRLDHGKSVKQWHTRPPFWCLEHESNCFHIMSIFLSEGLWLHTTLVLAVYMLMVFPPRHSGTRTLSRQYKSFLKICHPTSLSPCVLLYYHIDPWSYRFSYARPAETKRQYLSVFRTRPCYLLFWLNRIRARCLMMTISCPTCFLFSWRTYTSNHNRQDPNGGNQASMHKWNKMRLEKGFEKVYKIPSEVSNLPEQAVPSLNSKSLWMETLIQECQYFH